MISWIFCKSFDTFQCDRLDVIFVVAVFLVHIDHGIPQCLTLCLVVSCCFTQSHRCNDRIFVSCMCSDQAAIALLESEEVGSFSTLFKTKDLLSDVFESGQDFDEYAVRRIWRSFLPCL